MGAGVVIEDCASIIGGIIMTLRNMIRHALPATAMGVCLLSLTGCTDEPTMFANPDPQLRMKSTQWATDAAARFPFKENALRGAEPRCRAMVDYVLNRIEIVNFSDEEWSDIEVWVNHKYVCHVPKMQSRQLKEIHFPMLYTAHGEYFPLDNLKVRVESLELYRNGKMYDVTVHAND